jgi:uncharacterized protein YigE (DUF2233 family)
MAATRFSLLLGVGALGACGSAGPASPPVSPCVQQQFEQAGFIVCTPPDTAKLRLVAAASGETPKRAFRDLGTDAVHVAFAMNAGMFDEGGRPIGLAIVDGKTVHKIALRAGGGNFGMKPNGVFFVRKDGTAGIVTSEKFADGGDIRLATQSGPMLLVDGKLHPKFDHDGSSLYIRNAVGIGPDGTPEFVITTDPVSFGKLARFYRDRLNAKDALFLDGSVSSLWDPANGRQDVVTDLGPIIVALK